MSASMYNSPYVHKDPPPRIEYPPMMNFVHGLSFRHFLDSKFLALASILFLVGFLVSLVCVFSPFWFKLVFSAQEGTFGTEAVKLKYTIDTGIFYIGSDINQYDALMDLNKYNNQEVAPRPFVLAQILMMVGICLLVACLAATVILMLRKFASATAYFILAFFSSVAGLCYILTSLLMLITSTMSSCDPYDTGSSCKYEDNLKWRVIPMYNKFPRFEDVVHPYMKLNWTFYISFIADILVIAGSVMIWLEAMATFRQLSKIRYSQLRQARDPHEGDINPMDHGKYVYKPPVREGPGMYGMQPVMFQGAAYGVVNPPEPQAYPGGFSVGYMVDSPASSTAKPPRRRSPPPVRRGSPSAPSPSASPPPSPRSGRRSSPPSRRRSPPPSYRRRSPSPPSGRGPPSMNSSMSEGPYISREIDL